MKIWLKENPNLLREVIASIETNFPTLHVVVENDTVFIRGALHLPDDLGFYSIEIKLPDDYPDSVPLVWETGGKIPRIADRHINLAGNCCFFVPEETFKFYPKGTTIVDFIKNVVTGFFLNQTHFDSTGGWLWGERKHGILGILDFYETALKTDDLKVVHSFMRGLAKPNIREYQICYCGSKKKLGNCHFHFLRDYRRNIKPEIADNSLRLLNDAVKEFSNLQVQKNRQMIQQIIPIQLV